MNKGKKVYTPKGCMVQGNKAESRSESRENDPKQVMFSFFSHLELFGLPI